jgi:hypothetical protein
MKFSVWLEENRTINDFANPNEFYRIIVGDDAFEDIVRSGEVRTRGSTTYRGARPTPETQKISLDGRTTAFPSFSKGRANAIYANNNPNHYIITTTDPALKPSSMGRHGKGSTHFPTDDQGKTLGRLDAKNINVYKHMGDGQYELVYSKGTTT